MLSNATNQPKSIVELGYMYPRGLIGPPALRALKIKAFCFEIVRDFDIISVLQFHSSIFVIFPTFHSWLLSRFYLLLFACTCIHHDLKYISWTEKIMGLK